MKKLLAIICLAAFLQGCSTTDSWFGGDEDETILPGERLTILELEEQLEPDPDLTVDQIILPEAWNNEYWPQWGGYPNHAMGHVALASDLKRAWSADIGEGGSEFRPLLMPPIVADNVVFTLDSDMNVTAFHAASGKRAWRTELPIAKHARESALGGGIAFGEGKIFATTGLRNLYVMDPQNGTVLHTIDLPTPTRAAPSVLDGKVYVQTLDNRLNAYSTEDYKPVWAYTGFSETTTLLGGTAPAVNNDIVVGAFTTGEILAIRSLNGQSLWSDNLASVRPASALASIADIKGGVVLDKGIAYAISYNGKMVAIDTASGRRIWQRDIASTRTSWPAGNMLYVFTSEGELVALSRKDGRIHWVKPLGDARGFGPVFAGGRLIVLGSDGTVYEHDPLTGQQIRTWEIKGSPAVPPVISGGTMYVLEQNGKLTAYR